MVGRGGFGRGFVWQWVAWMHIWIAYWRVGLGMMFKCVGGWFRVLIKNKGRVLWFM